MNNVRRTIWSYGNYGLLCLLSAYNVQGHSQWTYYWAVIGVGSLIILVRLIFRPYYFEIKGTRLTINRDLFYTDSIEIQDIDKIELEEGPFSTSHIRLKDYKLGLDFNYFIVNDKDFNRLRDSLNLKVE
jgi:hypothetical protein